MLALVFWTTMVAVARDLIARLGPCTFIAVTSGCGGALLLVYECVRCRSLWAPLRLSRRYALFGGACFLGYFACVATSLGLAPSHEVAVQLGLVNYLWPTFLLLISVPMFGHRARWWLLLGGAGVAFCGAAVGMEKGVSLGRLLANMLANRGAFGLMLGAALSWGVYSNVAKKCRGDAGPGGVPVFHGVTGLVFLAARFLVGETSQWSASVAWPLVYATVFPTALGYVLWETGMTRGDKTFVSAASYLLPIGSVLFACWYLRVAPGANLLVGCVLVVAGAVLSKRGIVEEFPPAALSGPADRLE